MINIISWIKNNKFTTFIIVWLIIYVFFPFRPEPLTQIDFSSTRTHQILFKLWSKIPVALMLGLAFSIAYNKSNKLNIKYLEWTAVILLPLVFIVDWLAGDSAVTWGTMASGGLMIAIGLLVVRRFEYLGKVQSLFIAGLWCFGFMYGWEVMYQIVVWFKSNCNIEGELSAILSSVFIALPVVLVGILYKLSLNRWFWIILTTFIFTLILWYITGLNTLVYYDNGWVSEPLVYKSYICTRISKVMLGLLPFGIATIRLRNRFNNKNGAIKEVKRGI